MKNNELSHYINRSYFIEDLKSSTKDSVLKELVQPLVENGDIRNENLILEILKKRETLGSTGIGKSVAIPHCRTTTVSNVRLVIGISKHGINFNAMDSKIVKLVFLIIAPPQEEQNKYLPILGKICEMMRNSKIRKKLLETENFDSFLQVIQKG